MAGRLEGSVALITGAAGSIGVASAHALAAEGAQLVLSDRDETELVTLVGELGEQRACAVVADATDSEQVGASVQTALERFGALDVAFVNASVFGAVAPIVDYPEDVFQEVMAVNVYGAFLACKHALPALSDGGSLILGSSVAGLSTAAGICAYAASQHALVGLMRTAMHEAATRRIRVNTINAGPVRDGELLDQSIPLRRHATPEEIAATVVFLATFESAFITGATIAVDGGTSA
jgi:NAD(P)-dependent dehydrogenase (short-subunit alcohol dehydrogenase family)